MTRGSQSVPCLSLRLALLTADRDGDLRVHAARVSPELGPPLRVLPGRRRGRREGPADRGAGLRAPQVRHGID